MKREAIVLNKEFLALLTQCTGPTAITDVEGNAFGIYNPFPGKIPPWVTAELLSDREEEGGGRSLLEITADLEAKYGK